MFERELVIAGLRKQHNLLSELVNCLEEKADLNMTERVYEKTGIVAKNLRRLRTIKRGYCDYRKEFLCSS